MFKSPKTFKNLAFPSSRTPTSDPGEHIQLFFLTRKKPLTRIHTRTCMRAHNNKALTHVFFHYVCKYCNSYRQGIWNQQYWNSSLLCCINILGKRHVFSFQFRPCPWLATSLEKIRHWIQHRRQCSGKQIHGISKSLKYADMKK